MLFGRGGGVIKTEARTCHRPNIFVPSTNHVLLRVVCPPPTPVPNFLVQPANRHLPNLKCFAFAILLPTPPAAADCVHCPPQARREQGLEPFHAQDDVFHGARILVNTAFGVEYPHSLAPLVEMTGPLLPPRIARALSPRPPRPPSRMPPGKTRQHAGSTTKCPGAGAAAAERSPVESPSAGGEVDDGDDGDPLALPFLIRTWLGGTGGLVAPGTAAFEAVAKQAEKKERKESAGTGAVSTPGGLSLPDDGGVIYVNLGRMPQLDKWQQVTVLQALSSPSEATCWSGGVADDRLGPFRVLWVMPREQREQLLSALLPTAPPPSFRLKVLGGLPHLAVRAGGKRHAPKCIHCSIYCWREACSAYCECCVVREGV